MRHSSTRHFIHLLLLALIPLAVLSVLVAPALADALGANEPAAQEKPAAPSTGDESAAATDDTPASSDAAASDKGAPEQSQAASAPAVRAPIQASSVDFNINWTNAISSGVTAYSYDDAADPNHTNLIFHPGDNRGSLTATASVSLKINAPASETFLPGSIKITVPAVLYKGWDGTSNVNFSTYGGGRYLPTFKWQLVEAPKTSTSADFNYVDNGDGTLTITNYTTLAGGAQFYFEQAFSFTASHVRVDAQGVTHTSYNVTLTVDKDADGTNEVSATKTLTSELHNKNDDMSVALKHADLTPDDGVYLAWQNIWGAKPADADKYFYVIWHADVNRPWKNTIPYTYMFRQEQQDGELIGIQRYGWRKYGFSRDIDLNGETDSSYKDITKEGWRSYSDEPNGALREQFDPAYRKNNPWSESWLWNDGNEFWHPITRFALLERYPISLLEEAKAKGVDLQHDGLPVHNKVSVQETQSNGITREKKYAEADATVYVRPYGGKLGITKNSRISGEYGWYQFAQTFITQDRDAALTIASWPTFSTHATFQPPTTPTWDAATETYSVKPYVAEVEEATPRVVTENKFRDRRPASEVLPTMTELKDADYSYSSVSFRLSGQDATPGAQGTWQLVSGQGTDGEKLGATEILIRKAGSTNYELYGKLTVEYTGAKATPTYTFTPADGSEPTKGATVALPDSVVGLKYRVHSQYFRTSLTAATTLTLHPTAHLKGLIEADLAAKQATSLATSASLRLSEDGQQKSSADTLYQDARIAAARLLGLTVDTDLSKYQIWDINDNAALAVQTHWNEFRYRVITSLYNSGVKDSSYLAPYLIKTGMFYDLLPAGTTVDESRMQVYAGGTRLPKDCYTVTFHENWEGSGLTMMVVELSIPEEFRNAENRGHIYDVIIRYPLQNSYHNVADRGNKVLNTVAFHDTSDATKIDRSSSLTDPKILRNKYFQSLYTEDRSNWALTQTYIDYNPVTVKQSGVSKKVANDHDKLYGSQTSEYLGNKYSYQLLFGTSNSTRTDNLVFYDILDNGSKTESSAWRGTFDWIDLSSIKAKESWNHPGETCAPVVYYATKVPTTAQMDISNTSVWSTTEPANKASIKAIAIDCTKTNKGNDFSLDYGTGASAYVHMVAPTDEALVGKQAVNPVYAMARTFVGQSASSSDKVKPYEASAKIKLLGYDLELHKTSDPATGTKDAPAQIDNTKGTPVTYTLSVTNKGTELALRDIVIKDPIPGGLSVLRDQIKVTCPELKLNGASLTTATSVSASEEDGTLTLGIGSLPAGATMKLSIPTALTDDLIKSTTFVNTAHITSVEGHDKDIASETTYHKATKTYTLDYVVSPDPTYGMPGDSTTPATVSDIEYDTTQTLAKTLVTTQTGATKDGKEVQGYWTFAGWTHEQDGTEIITKLNIRKNETVYGRWVFVPTKDLTVTKSWAGISPAGTSNLSVTLELLRDGVATGNTQTLSAAGGWQATFKGLVLYDNAGKAHVYTVHEQGEKGGELTLASHDFTVTYGKDGHSVTNTLSNPKIQVKVSKVWDDKDDQDGIRPESVVVNLLANGKDTDKSATLTKENSWAFSFKDLDTYDGDGKAISYSVVEPTVPDGYTCSITGSQDKGFTVTNTHKPAERTINVTKSWIDDNNGRGLRPSSITVNLLANGSKVKSLALVADKDGNWKGSFNSVPVNAGGKAITYTVTEDAVEHYQATQPVAVENDTASITNTLVGTITIPVQKKWVGPAAKSVTIHLFADGQEIDSVTLDKASGWHHEFKDLPEYTNGVPIAYSVTEDPIAGYTTEDIEGNIQEGFTITNSYTPTSTSYEPSVQKRIEGLSPATPDSFEFVLTPKDSSFPMPESAKDGRAVAELSGEGTTTFGQISFTMPGTYSYTITETKGNAGCNYDDATYTLTLTVEDIGEGVLQVTQNSLTLTRGGTEKDAELSSEQGNAVFTNVYAKPTPAKPKVKRTKRALPKTGDVSNFAAGSLGALALGLIAGAALLARREHQCD
ncbi:Cna B-type domain-containing protein [Olegusella massiliensis]|uniref:Cna B-type domain-containing protein n=1 Tax=Olegusella massiliensis TaxID=1776381 RepID=UPI0023F8817E|nr:Cna B-type domain-containing protein [Olegusella massiliensis]